MEVSFWLHTETLVLNHTLAQIHLLLMRHTRKKNPLSTVTKVMKVFITYRVSFINILEDLGKSNASPLSSASFEHQALF